MPVGACIRLSVAVTHALRRQLSFACEVSDAANPALVVASGTHQRVYICSDAFDAALSAKAGETGVRVGLTGTSTHFVDVQHIASREVFGGPRSVEALSTSSLMAWAEEAAIAALEEHLPPGATTVGGETAIAHVAPTPKGMQVTCRALLTRISPTSRGALRLLFELSGEDRGGAVMTGTHLRFLVQRTDFERKARGVLMPDGRRRGSFAGALPPALTPAGAEAVGGAELSPEAAAAASSAAAAAAAAATPLPGRPPLPGALRPPPASAVAMGGTLPKLSLNTGGNGFIF